MTTWFLLPSHRRHRQSENWSKAVLPLPLVWYVGARKKMASLTYWEEGEDTIRVGLWLFFPDVCDNWAVSVSVIVNLVLHKRSCFVLCLFVSLFIIFTPKWFVYLVYHMCLSLSFYYDSYALFLNDKDMIGLMIPTSYIILLNFHCLIFVTIHMYL